MPKEIANEEPMRRYNEMQKKNTEEELSDVISKADDTEAGKLMLYEKLAWYKYLLMIAVPILLIIQILRLPIFPKSKREPSGCGCVLYAYESMTFSEKMIYQVKQLLP